MQTGHLKARVQMAHSCTRAPKIELRCDVDLFTVRACIVRIRVRQKEAQNCLAAPVVVTYTDASEDRTK